MIVVSLKHPSQLAQIGFEVEAVELRVDLLNLKIEEIALLMQQIKLPKILTLRSFRQGGQYAGNKSKQLEFLKQLAELKPDYLDVEYDLLPFTQREFPLSQKLLLSFHDWQRVPADLGLLLQRMKFFPAALYKIAVMPQSLSDLTRFLDFLGTTKGEILGIAMGELGVVSRQAAKRFGSCGTFACTEEGEATAPGQIPAKLLIERYNLAKQSKQTELYGLIGEAVSKSVSDLTHNHLLRRKGADALYLKIHTPKAELKACVEWIRRQAFQGVSVTMPHKEAIIPYLDALTPLAEAIGAVNTLFWREGQLVGDNTDAYGGLMALKEQMGTVRGKRLVLLGVGGAARALAHAVTQEGVELVCVGRDRDKAGCFAERFGGTALTFEEFCHLKPRYDILVNATPAAFPVAEEAIWPEAVVMTMQTKPVGDAFRRPLLTGFNMFVHQAVQQWKLWRPDWESAEVQQLLLDARSN